MNTSRGRSFAILLLIVGLLAAPAALAADEPVTITASMTGKMTPGAQLTIKVDIQIHDNSTIKSIRWEQIGGVDATLNGVDGANLKVRLAAERFYRSELINYLQEPPIKAALFPDNVPIPEGEFHGGLQDRWQVVGLNHFAREEAGLVELEVIVHTTSGTYREHVAIHTELPWPVATGLNNVPVGLRVLLHGKDQDRYTWRLTERPSGSKAKLRGPRSRNPSFVPDVPGIYELAVRDEALGQRVFLTVYAGTFRGIVAAQDAEGHPIGDSSCTICHSDVFAPDKFSQWARTGHAEIFSANLNTSTHYGEGCFECHTVGFNHEARNGGFDEAADYAEFEAAGLLNNPGDNWTAVLENFPATAKLANIQCENCHGPQNQGAHVDSKAHAPSMEAVGEPRVSLASDLCASCHGEPLRHARYQQWQISGHANFELAVDESQSGTCAKCHTANGFLAWLPEMMATDDPNARIDVTWTPDKAQPQTCVTCHDPHDIGTTSGNGTNAKMRIRGETPMLYAGFKAIGVGKGAICMTCHNSRRGLRNDATFAGLSDPERASHGSAQTDVLMGENAYGVNVGVRGPHSLIVDTCVNCHMEKTLPPDVLSYNQSGTNHTFYAGTESCARCHEEVTADVVQSTVEHVLQDLRGMIEDEYMTLLKAQVNMGYTVDFDGLFMLRASSKLQAVEFGETHGRQGLAVKVDGTWHEAVRMGDITVNRPAPLGTAALPDLVEPDVHKAGWNYTLIHNDGSLGAHNPRWVLTVLDASRDLLDPAAGGARSRAVDVLR